MNGHICVRCENCNCRVDTDRRHPNVRLCPECRKVRRADQDRARRWAKQRASTGRDPQAWVVWSDPLEEGGFDKGARFGACEIAYMLIMGSFVQGTVLLQPRTRKRFTVINQGGEWKLRSDKWIARGLRDKLVMEAIG